MNYEAIREYCLNKKGAEEGLPFGDTALVFKVGGRIFLILDLTSSPVEFNVKCEPSMAIELRENNTSVLPGYHMNKKHWNTVVCDTKIKKALIYAMIDISYNLVVSSLTKKMKEMLSQK